MAGAGPGRVRGGRLVIDLEPLLPVLASASQVYVGVSTSAGPHVTPELFTISGERIVCLTAPSTLKAKIVRREPMVALAARSSSGSVSAVASASVFDPADPRTAVASPRAAVSSPLGVARFVRDNASELSGAALDALGGRLGVPPERRVVLTIEVHDAALDEREGDVVIGWTRADGAPLALPATWEGDDRAVVSASLFDAMGAVDASPACATFDEWTGLGPSGKQGVLLRGHGTSTRDGDVMRLALDVERALEWDGVEVQATDLDG